MTAFALQLIAMTGMALDHIAVVFMDDFLPFRSIGRLAFPILALLVAETYRRVKDDRARMEACLGRLALLTVVSEIGFDLAFAEQMTVAGLLREQSCVPTLLLAFLGLIAIGRWKETRPLYMGCAVLLTSLAAQLLSADYGFAGVLMVYAFYWYLNRSEGKPYPARLLRMLVPLACFLVSMIFIEFVFGGRSAISRYFDQTYYVFLIAYFLIAIPLAAYNGKPGKRPKGFDRLFWWFYPAHLLVIGLIRLCMM